MAGLAAKNRRLPGSPGSRLMEEQGRAPSQRFQSKAPFLMA